MLLSYIPGREFFIRQVHNDTMNIGLDKSASVAKIVTTALVAVTTLVLAIFGLTNYHAEKVSRMEALHSELNSATVQLATSLALPLWNLEHQQVTKIIESSMGNDTIFAVVVKDRDATTIMNAQTRNADWKITPTPVDIDDPSLLVGRKEIVYNKEVLGSVSVYVTKRFTEAALRKSVLGMVASILVLNICLIAILFFLVRTIILRPLKVINDYTLEIRTGSGGIPIGKERFFGELENVRTSIEDMVGQLELRYSEIEQSRNELRVAEEKYHGIFENAIIGIFQSAPEGHFLSVNPSFARMAGFDSPEDMIGTITDIDKQFFCDSSDRERFENLIEAEGYVYNLEYRIRQQSGDPIWISVNALAVRDTNDTILYYEGTSIDITMRKNAEEALRDSIELFRGLTEQPLVGVYLVQDDIVRYVNDAFARTLGYEPWEIIDTMGPLDLVVPEDRHHVAENIRLRIDGFTDNLFYEFRMVRKDGARRDVESYSSQITYHGAPAILGILLDATERKHLEAQFIHSQKMDAIGQLAGGIAHDFNNILSVIIGASSLVKMRIDKENLLVRYVDQTISAAQKAAQLTKSLLAFSRKQQIDLQPVDLNNTVKNAKKLLSRLITEDIEFESILSDEPLTVQADRLQIEQIMMNLITNARDAITDKGKITIMTGNAVIDGKFVEFHGFGKPGAYATISVIDTGHGMDGETRSRIFEPFFTTKEVGRGTGLGLSIIYGIIKQHNGFIVVESQKGAGSTFVVYLPLVSPDTECAGKESAVQPLGGFEKILVAEDEQMLRSLIRDILESHGYSVLMAVDGEEALEIYRNNLDAIDLSILDVVMPKKNGKEVYDEIMELRPDAKVLFCSGYSRDIMLQKGVIDKEMNLLHKPVTPIELLMMVRDILDGRVSR